MGSMRTHGWLLGVLLISAVGACADDGGEGDPGGGGGGGGGSDVPAVAYCDPARTWPATATAHEAEIVRLVNAQRQAGATCGGVARPPVPPLTAVPALRCAARVHTLDMATQDYFDHTGKDGSAPWDRMESAGYAWSQAGENIAGGNAEPASTMEQWMNSSGHCNNIMSADYTEIGVSHVEDASLWTQVFGRPG